MAVLLLKRTESWSKVEAMISSQEQTKPTLRFW